MTTDAETGRRKVFAAAALLVAALVFLPAQVAHIRHSADPLVFNDDARQWVVPFFGGAVGGDWTSIYYRDITPIGQRALYGIAGATIGAERLSKILPYLLFGITCWLLAATTLVLTGSRAAALLSVCFLLSTPALMARMAGGSGRGFAFPILAAAAYGLASGRSRIIAVVTVVGAAFYPPGGLLAGVTLALSILVREPPARLRRHVTPVAVTALISAALLLPLALSSGGYGRAIAPSDVATFPEAGPYGRYMPGDRPPFPPLFVAAYRALDRGLSPAGTPLLPASLHGGIVARAVVLALAGIGLLLFARSSLGTRRLLLLPAASLLLYEAAVLFSPRLYIPVRYLSYSLVLLPALAIPVAAVALARATGLRAAAALSAIVLLVVGGTGSSSAGLTVNARPDAAFYQRLARVPDLGILAGWPLGPAENVPYLLHKPVLVTYETHAVLHAQMLLEMRRRMLALIDATFAASPEPLIRLRDSFGVTHLLVDRRHFVATPRYFAPFDEAIQNAARRLDRHTPEVLLQAPHATTFEYGPYLLLDLRRLRQ